MDPAAVKELQRLYAQKYSAGTDRPTKRRNLGSTSKCRIIRDESGISDAQAVSKEPPNVAESFSDAESDLDVQKTQQSLSEVVEVVTFDHNTVTGTGSTATKDYKSFMSGKVPKIIERQTSSKVRNPGDESSDDSEEDLKKDKELQKLLRESHLLVEQGGDSLETSGKIRHKAIQAQLISNGASKEKQQKMPLGMRKSMVAAAKKRAEAAVKHNRESGIVTARKTAEVKKKQNKTLHELNVGKYKNGKLTITRREIDRINGPKPSSSGQKKRGFRDFSNIG